MSDTTRQMPAYSELVALLGWEPNPTNVQDAADRGFTNPYMFKRPNETKAQRLERQRNMMAWNGKVTWAWAN
jgi:hypothetical protein